MGKHKSSAFSSEVNPIWIVLGAVAKKSVQISRNISQIKIREVCKPIGMEQIIHTELTLSVSYLPVWADPSGLGSVPADFPCPVKVARYLWVGGTTFSCNVQPTWQNPSLHCPSATIGWRVLGSVLGSVAAIFALEHQDSATLSCHPSGQLTWGSTDPSETPVMGVGAFRAHLDPVQGLCLPCQSTQGKPGETTSASLGPANTRGR